MFVDIRICWYQHIKKDEDQVQFDSHGVNLSLGLKKILRYCPSCEEDNCLIEQGNDLSCSYCDEVWTVNANNEIKSTNIKNTIEIFDKLKLIIDKKWNDKKSYSSLSEVVLLDMTKKDWEDKDIGILHIDNKEISIGESEIKLEDIQSHTLDWGDLIIVKTKYERFGLKLTNDSRLIVSHILTKAMNVKN